MKIKIQNVYFQVSHSEDDLPDSFSIVTAYNPIGLKVTDEENKTANEIMLKEMVTFPQKFGVVIGDTQSMLESEVGFGCGARLHTMYDLAQRWHQFASYFIDGNELSLVSEEGEMLLISGGFRSRVMKYGDTEWL